MKLETLKLTTSKRTEAKEPINLNIWVRNGISEFLGTILLSLLLAGASLVVYKDGAAYKDLADYLFTPVIVGLYAGFVAVGLCLIIFVRWSCDLNPMVTTYRMITGTNTYRYGFYKIAIQILGGISGGLIIYAVGKGVAIEGGVVNKAITTSGAIGKLYPSSTSQELGGLWIFALEVLIGIILLYSIFSKTISEKYRLVTILFVISMSVWAGIHGGSPAINPARGLAQEIPSLFFGHKVGQAQSMNDVGFATLALMLGGFVAPFAYALLQDFNAKYFSPVLYKLVETGNNNANLMGTLGSKRKTDGLEKSNKNKK